MRGASRRFFTNRQPPLCSRGSVAPRRTSNRRFTGDYIHSSPLRRGATEPPKSHPSPKLLADAKGAQRAECPHPNHIVLSTIAKSNNQAATYCIPTQGDAASPLRQARRPQAPTEICRLYFRCFIKHENQSQDTPSQCDGMSWLKLNTSSDLFAIIFLLEGS